MHKDGEILFQQWLRYSQQSKTNTTLCLKKTSQAICDFNKHAWTNFDNF